MPSWGRCVSDARFDRPRSFLPRAVRKSSRRFCHEVGDFGSFPRRLSSANLMATMVLASVQFIIAMIAYALNERTARKLAYAQEEVRVLMEVVAEATGKIRVTFTADQRRRLALKGKELTPAEREACCQIVRPATILAWFQRLAAR